MSDNFVELEIYLFEEFDLLVILGMLSIGKVSKLLIILGLFVFVEYFEVLYGE